MMRQRCQCCDSHQVTQSQRRGAFETRVLPLLLLRPFRCLKCCRRYYGFALAWRSSPKEKQSETVRAGLLWMTQRAHLLMFFLSVPLVMAGVRIYPWHPDRQPSGVSEIRNETGKRDRPVVRAATPVAFGWREDVMESPHISNTKDTIAEGGTHEPKESMVANFGAQEASQLPLGVLSTTGGVSINNSPAPSQATIFAGDSVRTDDRGLATFTLSGQGSIGIDVNAEVSFVDDPNYVALLHRGALTIRFFTGATTKFRLRVLNYFVAAQQDTEGTAEIEQTGEASATVNCLSGSVVVTGAQGEAHFLQAGQSFGIETVEAEVPTPQSPPPAAKSHRTTWIVIGLAAGGGAAGAAAALGHKGGQTVSPSSP